MSSITFSSGSNLSTLNDYVFQSCPITKILIPASVATISTSAFASCVALTDVDFEDGCLLSIMDRYFGGSPIAKVKIPANVTKITYNAFSNFEQLQVVDFEDNSKCIEIEGVVEQAENYGTMKMTERKNISGAFFNCINLGTINIPASVETIGPAAFYGCSNLECISFENGSHLKTIQGVSSSRYWLERVRNASFYGGWSCGAFAHCASVSSIILPKALLDLGEEAFNGCHSLSSVKFENGSSLCSVGRFAFLDCNNLSSITLPAAVSKIGFGAFSGCTNLSNIAIEGSAISMMIETVSKDDLSYSGGSGAPYRYNDNVEEYGTFYGCLSLSTISLPSRLTDIGNYAFYGCTALNTIKFSENATLATIGDYGFYDCPVLHTVDMSNCNQVTKIGASAFQSSDEMRLFKIGTVVPPTCGSTPFGAVGNYSVLKVPDGAVTQYQSASGWKDFASITGLNE